MGDKYWIQLKCAKNKIVMRFESEKIKVRKKIKK